MTKVIVVGGGIGGLALAQGLRGAGLGVEVYERDRHRTDRLQGFRIHINPDGAAALRECLPAEAFERFLASSGKGGNQFTMVTERLKRLLHLDEETIGTGHHGVSRITLRQILLSGMEDVVRFDRKFERYSVADDGRVTAHFADGTTAVGDVLVGADGAGSRVRGQYLPHAERVDTGIVAIAGKYMLTEERRELIPPAFLAGPLSVLPSKSCGMFIAPHDFDGGVNDQDDPDALFDNTAPYVFWSFSAKREYFGEDLDSLGARELRDLVLRSTTGWAPQLRALVALSDVDTTTLLPIRSAAPVPKWAASSVTLLGDAAHSMTPFRGVGANIALRDAQLLCRKLIEAERPLVERIAEYEAEMTEYGFAAVRASLTAAKQAVSGGRAARLAGRAAFRVLDAVPALKRRAFADIGR
ncbi:FAD-dependent monooxygenase [Allokutzneria sp. A3M-2-11 16]|uniref:FAD-dependent oxidoreductase n=1 Tax=Allokutzneria sp. A3M-2-11 16 TaxID=2962043 RepID=UPI0020B6EA29|nr:NAD(P)/FAD-dependent oxidoreductase [Allokutzneria sp. A3M-2-11 16]MCP3804769.1 FAD-dependent monooxygenase [Allokutzneria sp. A3M-2-11 16]